MKDENTPKILEERLTGTAPKLSKATDQVPLNLVTVKREAPSAFRLDDPGTWPVVVQFLLYPKTLGGAHFIPFRLLLVVLMIFFTVQLMRDGYDAWIAQYLHCLNLPVHETGHIVLFFGNCFAR